MPTVVRMDWTDGNAHDGKVGDTTISSMKSRFLSGITEFFGDEDLPCGRIKTNRTSRS
jgi:hypothetical protein